MLSKTNKEQLKEMLKNEDLFDVLSVIEDFCYERAHDDRRYDCLRMKFQSTMSYITKQFTDKQD